MIICALWTLDMQDSSSACFIHGADKPSYWEPCHYYGAILFLRIYSLKELLPTLGSHMLCFYRKQICLFSCLISFSWKKINLLWASWMEILLTEVPLRLTVLPRETFQYIRVPHPCLYFSSLHLFFLLFRVPFQKLDCGWAAGRV